MAELDSDTLRAWVGRSEIRVDSIDARPIALLSATLDRDDPAPRAGDVVPPLWHWLYFLPGYRQSEVGADGHARRGGFLPPVPLPRRMWAGSRMRWHRPLTIGATATRNSRIVSVTPKHGRSGDLLGLGWGGPHGRGNFSLQFVAGGLHLRGGGYLRGGDVLV